MDDQIIYIEQKDKDNAIDWLRNSASEINSLIFKYTEDNPESKGMGTTLVAAIVTDEYILFGNECLTYLFINNYLIIFD